MLRAIVCERRKENGLGVIVGGVAVAMLAILVSPAAAVAQETRAAEIAQKQAGEGRHRRALRPHPVREGDDEHRERVRQSAERRVSLLRERLLWRRLHARSRLPSVLRPRGGVGGQRSLLDQELQADRVRDAGAVELQRSPDKGHPRGVERRTQVGFYGTGMDAVKDDRVNFRIKQTYLTGDLGFRPTSWTRLDARCRTRTSGTKKGRARPRPSRPSTTPRPRRDCSSA